MELEEVGFSAIVFHVEEAGNGKEREMWALAENARKLHNSAVVRVLADLGGHHQKFSPVIHKLLEEKKKKTKQTVLVFYNLEQTSTSLYVIPNLRIM